MAGKSKIVRAPSLVETFPNIMQQFEIDVDVTPCLKLLRLFDDFKHLGKLFQIVGVKQDNVFWPEHVLLDGCFSFKTEDLVFI